MICILAKGLKKLWKIVGLTRKSKVYIIKSGEHYTGIKLFEDFLKNEIQGKEILLCDPYIAPETLDPFSTLKGRVTSIKILTSNIYDKERFKNYVKRFQKQYNLLVEIKVTQKIHDRYLVCGKICWSFGSSIKDLGNKDTLIKDTSEVVHSLTSLFQERWNDAKTVW